MEYTRAFLYILPRLFRRTYLFRRVDSLAIKFVMAGGLKLVQHVTSPPNEKRTIGGDAQFGYLFGVGLHDPGGVWVGEEF